MHSLLSGSCCGVVQCHGSYEAAFFGIGVLASYLYLFVLLYRDSYNNKHKHKHKDKHAASNGKAKGDSEAAANSDKRD